MLTFNDLVNGIAVTKTLFTVNSSAVPQTIVGTDGVSSTEDYVKIGGLHLKVGDYFFLDAKDATTYGPLVTAVSNNTLAAAANTNTPNATVQLTSVGA